MCRITQIWFERGFALIWQKSNESSVRVMFSFSFRLELLGEIFEHLTVFIFIKIFFLSCGGRADMRVTYGFNNYFW